MIPVPKDAIDEIGRLAAEVSRLHEIVCEHDDMIAELTEQVDYLVGRNEELMVFLNASRDRVADLGEALDMLAIATRKYRSLPRIDGDTIGRLEAELGEALEKARALRGDAPKEERCHVWGRDVSRWKLPEFAPTGNAGDPDAR